MTSSEPSEPLAADQVELIIGHLWLADSFARRFRGRGEDDDDLQQVARSALLDAARRYDPTHGPFVPFASPTIAGVLKRHFRDHGWAIRPPRRIQELSVRISHEWPSLAQQHGDLPDDRDLAELLGEPADAILEARRAAAGYRTVPLDGPSGPIWSTAVEDPEFARSEAHLVVVRLWRCLHEDERVLLRSRFWENRSQADIAAETGASQMHVSRLLTRLLKRLRDLLEDDLETDSVPQSQPWAA